MSTITKRQPFYSDPSINLIDREVWDNSKEVPFELKSVIWEILQKEFPATGCSLSDISIEKPKDANLGAYATNIALKLGAKMGKQPNELADLIVNAWDKYASKGSLAQNFIAEWKAPGFINFKYSEDQVLLGATLTKILTQKDAFGNNEILKGKSIMMEYAHPNPFKVIHIGHMRNVFYGESLIRILEAHGAKVIRTNYQGDVGMHVAKSIWGMIKKLALDNLTFVELEELSLEERMTFIGKSYQLGASAYEEDVQAKEQIREINYLVYAVAQKAEMLKYDWQPKVKYLDFVKTQNFKLDQIELFWKKGVAWSLEANHQFYDRVYSSFEREYMESETQYYSEQNIAESLAKGILQESEGAVVFKGQKYGLDTRVFVNSMGLPTYEGKEMGLAPMEFNDFGDIDLCIHNVAVEQISFFRVTFKAQELLDPAKYQGKQYHTAYEFVGLKSGKMSSRKGIVVLANDILDEAQQRIAGVISERNLPNKQEVAEVVGTGAVKYSFLNINPRTYLAFDLETSLNFEGNSGPYLQYTYARGNKILKDYGKQDYILSESEYKFSSLDELDLAARLALFPQTVIEAAKDLNTNEITSYLFELAQTFNIFYKKHKILTATEGIERNTRLALTAASVQVIKNGLYLLGIKTVDSM